MKIFFTIIVWLMAQPILAQKKITNDELIRFDWIVYNSLVADSAEILKSDTLLLIKSYDNEDVENISSFSCKCWGLSFSNITTDIAVDSDEFSFSYIDLRQAAIRRRLWVDSSTFEILFKSPSDLSSESSQIRSVLDNLETGDYIEIIDSIHQQNFHLLKLNDGFQVYNSLKGRFVHFPKGVNSGFWTLSKQKLMFSNRFGDKSYEFQVERIDKMRIRLVRVQTALNKN